MTWKTLPAVLLLVGMTAMSLIACTPTSGAPDAHSTPSATGWEEGKTYGQWRLVYDGYGAVTGDDRKVIMQPASATSMDRTHACLVVTERATSGDVDFSVTVRTEEHVRDDEPNPWEVGWVLWNYQDDEHFYALALKPNGWELSKQDPAYPGNQRFLLTGSVPEFPLHEDHRVRIVQEGDAIAAYANDRLLGRFTDRESPYVHGRIGLYTEDARVRFSDLDVRSTDAP